LGKIIAAEIHPISDLSELSGFVYIIIENNNENGLSFLTNRML